MDGASWDCVVTSDRDDIPDDEESALHVHRNALQTCFLVFDEGKGVYRCTYCGHMLTVVEAEWEPCRMQTARDRHA